MHGSQPRTDLTLPALGHGMLPDVVWPSLWLWVSGCASALALNKWQLSTVSHQRRTVTRAQALALTTRQGVSRTTVAGQQW